MAAALLLLLWGVLMLLAQRIPPFQSPDEHSHVARAHALCQGELLLHTPPGGSSGVHVDTQLVELMHVYMRLVPDAALRLSADEQQAAAALRWSGERAFVPVPGTGWYLPPIYAPAALGLCLGQWLDLPVKASHDLARALTLSASLLVLVAALRLHAPGPLALLLLVLPMSLFQWLSPTIDGLSHALTMWAGCVLLRLRADAGAGQAPRPALAWIWLAVLALLAGTRPHLWPLLLLPLALPGRGWRALRLATLPTAVAVLAWTLWAASTIVDQRVVREAGLGEVLRHYLLHPGAAWAAAQATLGDPETLRFYGRSFVGVLGWLDTLLPPWAYPLLGWTLVAVALLSGLRGAVGLALGAGWLWVVALACLPLIFVAMLLGWSAFPADRIEGVQGRYFIAPALLAALALSAPPVAAMSRWRRVAGTLAAAAATLGAWAALLAFALALQARYH